MMALFAMTATFQFRVSEKRSGKLALVFFLLAVFLRPSRDLRTHDDGRDRRLPGCFSRLVASLRYLAWFSRSWCDCAGTIRIYD